MMVASLVLPAVLFAFAAWSNYRDVARLNDERIDRSVDVLHEHALKVFQTVERSMAEVEALTEDMSDDETRSNEARLHERFKRIVEGLPQIQTVALFDREGRGLVSSTFLPLATSISDREYFRAHVENDVGIFISEAFVPRTRGIGPLIFNLSKRRPTFDGSFNGVVLIALRPDYFEDFYARIGRSPGSYYSLLRDDGVFLARYPPQGNSPRNLNPNSQLLKAIGKGEKRGIFTVTTAVSQVDGIERRIGFRKISGFPAYVQAGIETSAITAEWRAGLVGHLWFGIPLTLMLFGIIWLALQRTRRLYAEAERREAAEGALRQSQRLEAIGQLTGGVAHDFNNLLMVVNGSVQRLRRDITEPRHVRLLDMITTASQRGESLTRQLLAFSRQQTLTPVAISLNELLPELEEMLRRSLRGDIVIKTVLPATTCSVKVDPSELELAILNIAVNARDAMPKGGTLTITARPITLKGEAQDEDLRGEFVALRLADTGTGIPPEVLARVFEPFFTTKDVGKGTGLGLSQVYGFARQSGGTATVTSTLGKGTAITLYLPRTYEGAIAPVPTPAPAVAAQAFGAGTVLAVEDNDEVADACAAYLAQLGYQVKSVSNAKAALDLLRAGERFDVVFSDILMPGGMNGVELATAIRTEFPEVPVLLTTGYSASAQDAVLRNFMVLQKPYDLDALRKGLIETIRQTARLEGKAEPGLKSAG